MRAVQSILTFVAGTLLSASATLATVDGLLAEWKFDEPSGLTAADSSGNGHQATLSGATRDPMPNGYALSLDGIDDYVDCGTLPINGPVAFELWIKPLRKGHGMSVVMGEDLSSFLVTYYNTEVCDFYVGGGGNNSRGKLLLDEWNHVVVSFDGNYIDQWVNGQMTMHLESRYKTYQTKGQVFIGTKGQPALPRFKGLIDHVRIYNRAQTNDEVLARYRAEAADYGIDAASFGRVKATLYQYFGGDDPHIVIDADYKNMIPLQGNGRLEVTLYHPDRPNDILQQHVSDPAPARERYGGVVEARLSCRDLPPGEYLVRVALSDAHGPYPVEELTFTCPGPIATPPLPDPAQQVAAPLPQIQETPPFEVAVMKAGGFAIRQNGVTYPFTTRISWPNGNFNTLAASNQMSADAEKGFGVRTSQVDEGHWKTESFGGKFYKVTRELSVHKTHVSIKDTYTNLTENDLGLLIYNDTPIDPQRITTAMLSGHERFGRQVEMPYPDYGPSTFFADGKSGLGIVPVDDVFVVQALPYVGWDNLVGVGTEKFALPAGKSYTLEWAVYPVASQDYYDFINNFRKAENRIGTIAGAPGYITNTLHVPERRNVPGPEYSALRRLAIGIMHNLAYIADDPDLSVEGFEFVDFPQEMELIRQQRETIRQIHPNLKAIFHIAHSLYCTNDPERFADSKVIGADGNQPTWGDGSVFGEAKKAQGWRWWIFYPTPGNSFHDAMMKSIDVMMDQIGMDGGFMDGFMAGYGGHWSYDTNVRWDGHSAEIDTVTRTITRKINSVILLSQPSMLEYAHRVQGKGGVIVALHNVFTRTLGREKEIIFSNESASGPELHLSPTASVLGATDGFNSERAIYRDMLDKLKWGELYLHYSDGRPLTHESFAARQYPMTFEQIRAGMVRGPQRIVTMNAGSYTWNDSRLHIVYYFDGRGAPAPHSFITTVESGVSRTELPLDKFESAAIVPIPVSVESKNAVNAHVTKYDANGLDLQLNGHGNIRLDLHGGELDITAVSRVQVNGNDIDFTLANDTLSIPIALDGLTTITAFNTSTPD